MRASATPASMMAAQAASVAAPTGSPVDASGFGLLLT